MDNNFLYEDDTDQLGSLGKKGSTKALLMTFVVDTSGSMAHDGRIEAVNQAFDRMIPVLKKQDEENDTYTLYIAIMTFNIGVNWVVTPTKISEYNHAPLQVLDNYATRYSLAFESLNEKLSLDNFMDLSGRKARPYILFMTDGAPSKGDDYLTVLNQLKTTNGWFVNADRYAVLMGSAASDPAAKEVVSVFVDDPREGILTAERAEEIASKIEAHTLRTIDLRLDKGGDVVTPTVGTTPAAPQLNPGTNPFGTPAAPAPIVTPGTTPGQLGGYVGTSQFNW